MESMQVASSVAKSVVGAYKKYGSLLAKLWTEDEAVRVQSPCSRDVRVHSFQMPAHQHSTCS